MALNTADISIRLVGAAQRTLRLCSSHGRRRRKQTIYRAAHSTPRAYPGEEGVCVIYGHRNRNHFQVLKDIDFGDTITVTLADGTVLSYTVESIRILEPDEELRVPLISGQHLMLTTCYPFYYTGHAPKKYVLIARYNT